MKSVSQKFISVSTAAFLLANAAAITAPAAQAADMLADQQVELTPVEYGTGWYLRADIMPTITNEHFNTETSETIPGTSDQRVSSVNATNVFGAGVGIGYRLSNNIRIDANYEYLGSGEARTSEPLPTGITRPPCENGFYDGFVSDANGNLIPAQLRRDIDNCTTTDTKEFSLTGINIQGYYEFDTSFAGLRPFLGAGIGVIRSDYTSNIGSTTCVARDNEICNPTDGQEADYDDNITQEGVRENGISYHLAPSVTLGLSYDLGNSLYMDTAYRYTKMLSSPLYGGSAASDEVEVPTDFHTFKLGLRYEIW